MSKNDGKIEIFFCNSLFFNCYPLVSNLVYREENSLCEEKTFKMFLKIFLDLIGHL